MAAFLEARRIGDKENAKAKAENGGRRGSMATVNRMTKALSIKATMTK